MAFWAALTELHDALVDSFSSCAGAEAKPEMMRSVVVLPSSCAYGLQLHQSSASMVPPEPRVRARQSSMQVFFPGFNWDTVLVKLSCAELAVYCFEHILSLGTPNSCHLVQLGASWAPLVSSGQVWRLVVPIFLHGNFGHVLTNVLFQMRLGFKIEEMLGKWRFLSLYLLSGTFGNLTSAVLQPAKVAVGASTSAMGILGATVVRLLHEEPGPEQQAMLISSFLILIAINLSPHADIFGHLGGFLTGVCYMLCTTPNVNANLRFWSAASMILAGGWCCHDLAFSSADGHLADACAALPNLHEWLQNAGLLTPARAISTTVATAAHLH